MNAIRLDRQTKDPWVFYFIYLAIRASESRIAACRRGRSVVAASGEECVISDTLAVYSSQTSQAACQRQQQGCHYVVVGSHQ